MQKNAPWEDRPHEPANADPPAAGLPPAGVIERREHERAAKRRRAIGRIGAEGFQDRALQRGRDCEGSEHPGTRVARAASQKVRDNCRSAELLVRPAGARACRVWTESSSRGAKRRGDPGSRSAFYVPLIGVGKAFASPPSEPYGRFSRIRLSSRWGPHRDCLACRQAVSRVNSPAEAKKALGQRRRSSGAAPQPGRLSCLRNIARSRQRTKASTSLRPEVACLK